jgi:hypothetical protein
MLHVLDAGLSVHPIAHQTGLSTATISRIHFEHCSDQPKSSGGRPTKLTTTNVDYARRIIHMGKVENATEAAHTLQDITNTPFCWE